MKYTQFQNSKANIWFLEGNFEKRIRFFFPYDSISQKIGLVQYTAERCTVL